mgnify:CR=1 FL=1
MDVAAKLVEQQIKCQPAAGLFGPVIEFDFVGHFDVVGKLLLALMIEDRIFTKPDVQAPVDLRRRQFMFLEPEGQDGVDADGIFVGDRGIHAFAEQFDRHGSKPLAGWAKLPGAL